MGRILYSSTGSRFVSNDLPLSFAHSAKLDSFCVGIGLEVHEHPYLNSGNAHQVIQPGETFSNEPGIYIERSKDTEGSGIGVRLEDMVLKTETGWELVSASELAASPCSP